MPQRVNPRDDRQADLWLRADRRDCAGWLARRPALPSPVWVRMCGERVDVLVPATLTAGVVL